MSRIAQIAVGALVLSGMSIPLHACSMAGCLNQGIEMRSSFTVRVSHNGKPLPGVTVTVRAVMDPKTESKDESPKLLITAKTDARGELHTVNLPPGNYWINASLLGFDAGDTCFHVNRRPQRPKGSFEFTWGDDAIQTLAVAGSLSATKPGPGKSPIERITHSVRGPVASAPMTLTNALTQQRYTAATSSDGGFVFADVPEGAYVLSIGDNRSDFAERSLMLQVVTSAHRDHLSLMAVETSCGPGIEVQD
jgi:hypothetical protein